MFKFNYYFFAHAHCNLADNYNVHETSYKRKLRGLADKVLL